MGSQHSHSWLKEDFHNRFLKGTQETNVCDGTLCAFYVIINLMPPFKLQCIFLKMRVLLPPTLTPEVESRRPLT